MIKLLVFIVLIATLGASFYYLFINQPPNTPQPSPQKVYKIGVIQTANNMDPMQKGFVDTLKALNYQEGKNIIILHKTVNSDIDLAKQTAEEYVQNNVDIIVTWGNLPTRAAQEITKDSQIPIVFFAADPVGQKFVESYQKPGGNLTGVDSALATTATKRLELFKQMAPKISKILFFYNNPGAVALTDMRTAATNLGVKLVEKKVEDVEDLDQQMQNLKAEEFDAIYRTPDSIISPRTDQIIALSLKYKVPYSGTNNADTEKGGLMSYGTDFYKYGSQAAYFGDKIFKGQKPSELPVELPKETELYLNLKTAALLDLTIPDTFLRRANKIIE